MARFPSDFKAHAISFYSILFFFCHYIFPDQMQLHDPQISLSMFFPSAQFTNTVESSKKFFASN